ncbi:hypothetical protein KDE12_07620 [Campylobacter sp. faydin G-105]|uniref:hypothetical protein n=1 Tax=Campylobacter anatolicus TaxID=2829105 RepID=UPI001B9C9208|nr:hypothetical protein [Campylobacter anatolicus]MBR8462707.1 hypothetical protein [Campylobacter anatolicus]
MSRQNAVLEVVLKCLILVLLVAFLLTLLFSGYTFLQGDFSEFSINLYTFFAICLVVFTTIYSYLSKKKLKSSQKSLKHTFGRRCSLIVVQLAL